MFHCYYFKINWIWKISLSIDFSSILLAGIIFVGVNNGLAYSTVRTGHKKYEDAKVYYLKSDSKCTQEFKGYDGTLEDMSIYIDNQGRESSKGSIDSYCKLTRMEMNLQLLQNR